MAIISSVALGKVQKSVGNVTFQHYYGKTVAKQKIVRNPNYVPSAKQKEQRDRMYYAFKFANAWDGLTDMLFVRSKWGTKRNNWAKLNYPAIAAYVNANESLVLPSQGNYLTMLDMLLSKFTTYEHPVYLAKGNDATLNCVCSVGAFASGTTHITFNVSVTDSFFKKVQYRILYMQNSSTASPYTGQAPIQASPFKDLTLTEGTWAGLSTDIAVYHSAISSFGFIFQVMIDDMPTTINVLGLPASNNVPAAIIQLPIA